MPKFYISTSIAYVNARPHIGFAMEVIQADVLARFHRAQGTPVFYLTGTDEHGMKIAQAAKEKNLTPQAFTDEISAHFRALKDLLNLSNDRFIRTTDADHIKSAQKIWMKMFEAGDFYKGSYEGLYCVGCESFITEKDLVNGMCPNHNKAPEKLKEENYFFKLSKYSEQIRKLIEDDVLKIVPAARKHEILTVLKEGLKDVSFSRPKAALEWGIEVPNDPSQVMYVWCDALSNYITGVGYADEENAGSVGAELFKKFWPADVHLIGKDILRFHSAIWIGMLLSAGIRLPHNIYVHGFITSEGKKMSKSLNNVVDPVDVVKQYSADALRYYVLREIPTTEDGDFSQERFKVLYESELANTFGNLVSRVLAMNQKYFEGKVPDASKTPGNAATNDFFDSKLQDLWKKYDQHMNAFDLKAALEQAIELGYFANEYVESQKPWVLAKEDQLKLAEVIYNLLEMIRQLGLLLLPFIPMTAGKILEYLGISAESVRTDAARKWGLLPVGQEVSKAEPLFPRLIEEKPIT
ncbi:MAG: methionine--tRNA ligase [Candidatus Gracilibacteria bacterium]